MGSEHSRVEEENRRREEEKKELEKSIKETNGEREFSLMRRLLKLHEDTTEDFKEKAKYLVSKVDTLEVENMNLKINVAVLAGKVEKLENEKLLNVRETSKNSDFEKRIKHLENHNGLVSHPPFQETRVFENSSSSPKMFPKPRLPDGASNTTVAPFKNDVICMKPSRLKTTLPSNQNPPSSPHYTHPLPSELTSLCKVYYCDLCQLSLLSPIMANEHYWGTKHFDVLQKYLENSYKETPELKPEYKPSDTYNRPLPLAVTSLCTPVQCGVCSLPIPEDSGAVHEHYHGGSHIAQVLKILQKNPQLWSDGFSTTSSLPSYDARLQIKVPPIKAIKETTRNPLPSPHYDHPLPSELTNLCKVDMCGLCQRKLHSEIEASTHYWGRKHFDVLQDYLENSHKATPELKPKYNPADTHNRPLPSAVISQCSTKKCGLCSFKIMNAVGAAHDHYHGGPHNTEVVKFLQKNTQHWSEGFSSLSSQGNVSPIPKKEASSNSRAETDDVTPNKPDSAQIIYTSPNLLSMHPYYTQPLPLELTSLCKADWCGLCQVRLAEKIMANEHYWGKKHFEVLQYYLENSYKGTPELKPRYKPSVLFKRPLPVVIIKKCTPLKCGLCDLVIAEDAGAVQEHYYGSLHEKQVCKFLQRNPQHWSEGLPPISRAGTVHSPAPPSFGVAPRSWLPGSSRSLPTEVLNQFRQNKCELCSATATFHTEAVARSHYKGKRHLSIVEQLQDSPIMLHLSDQILFDQEKVLSTVNNKKISTVDESCDEVVKGTILFIGCETLGKVKEFIIQEVFIINGDGIKVLDDHVSIIEETEESSPKAIGANVTAEVSEFELFQSRVKDVIMNNMLVGYDLGQKLKDLKMDHPKHLTRDLRIKFSTLPGGFKPSLKLILAKLLKISEFQHSKESEAKAVKEVYEKMNVDWKVGKDNKVECKILMPPFAGIIIPKLLKKQKLKDISFVFQCVSVLSFSSQKVESVAKSLLSFLRLINYGQDIEASELKLIVPSSLKLRKEDLVSDTVVTMYERLLPKSKEKVVGFGGNHDDMVSGVFQCLELMGKSGHGYGGPGSRYDSSDYDEETATLYGGWSGEIFQDDEEMEREVKCHSCSVVGAEHFSWTQLGKGDEGKCTSCVALTKPLHN